MHRIATAPNTIPAISPAGTEDLRRGRDVDPPVEVVDEGEGEDEDDVDPSVDEAGPVVGSVDVVLLLGCDVCDVLGKD